MSSYEVREKYYTRASCKMFKVNIGLCYQMKCMKRTINHKWGRLKALIGIICKKRIRKKERKRIENAHFVASKYILFNFLHSHLIRLFSERFYEEFVCPNKID